jgi:hypothetical protein
MESESEVGEISTWIIAGAQSDECIVILAPHGEMTLKFAKKTHEYLQELESPKAIVACAGHQRTVKLEEFKKMRAEDIYFIWQGKRATLITPVLKQATQSVSSIVVLKENESVPSPHDILDWFEFSDARVLEVTTAEQSCAKIIAHICRNSLSVQKLSVWSPCAVPVCWDRSQFEFDSNSFRLISIGTLHTSSSIKFHGPSKLAPEIHSAPAGNFVGHAERVDSLTESALKWTAFDSSDFQVVTQCLNSSEYRCPICQELHPNSELKCRRGGSILGMPVLHAVEDYPEEGILLVRRDGKELQYCYFRSPVLWVGNEKIGRRKGASLVILNRDENGEIGQISQVLSQFESLRGGLNVVLP